MLICLTKRIHHGGQIFWPVVLNILMMLFCCTQSKHFKRIILLILSSQALKVQLDSDRILYLLPTSKFTDDLGVTVPGYPNVLHVITVSRVPQMMHYTGMYIQTWLGMHEQP